jgi:hypothetical protein
MLILLNVVEVAESHTGVVLADTFFKVLKAFDIEKKVRFSSARTNGHSPEWQVLSITVDNASNNDTMFMHLDKLLIGYPRPIN